MWDKTIKYHDLVMEIPTLEHIPELPLPPGYSLRYYQPGDERHWARIERGAEEFTNNADAYRAFEKYYGDRRLELPGRMMFLLDNNGLPVGTLTAWNDGARGQLHWVGIATGHQGQGLARPMCAAALRRMRELGHTDAYLTTQTPSWVAVKVYLQLGFLPAAPDQSGFMEGWNVIREKLPGMVP